MPTFTYSARSVTGELQAGSVELPSREDVIGYLRRQRLVPVKVEQKQSGISIPGMQPGVTTRDIVIFTRQFATMINSGLPLVQSLDILAKQSENKTLRKSIEQVLYDVESGQTLADALRQHPKIFTQLYVNMVAAGEAGGILDTILLRLAVFLEKADALRRKIKGAMVYPGVIMTVAAGAVAVLLIFVIPTFQTMFESAGVPLPMRQSSKGTSRRAPSSKARQARQSSAVVSPSMVAATSPCSSPTACFPMPTSSTRSTGGERRPPPPGGRLCVTSTTRCGT